MTQCYLTVFCKFKDRETQKKWMRDHVIGQGVPQGGPVFSWSGDNESGYRDALIKINEMESTPNEDVNIGMARCQEIAEYALKD